MSINAIEVLEERLKGRVRKPFNLDDCGVPYYPEDYPPPAATQFEVTPATGVPLVS